MDFRPRSRTVPGVFSSGSLIPIPGETSHDLSWLDSQALRCFGAPYGPQVARPAIDFAAVRAALTIAQVLALLGFTPRSDHAGQQRGACPLHGATPGTARCFSVNTQAHTCHCFTCGRSGNALDLWAAANRLSIYDAAVDLCQRLNIPLPRLPAPAAGNREEEPVATGSGTCTIP